MFAELIAEVNNMAVLNEKNVVIGENGIDKYTVADLKRVYGCAEHDGGQYVFLGFPECTGDKERDYRPGSCVYAIKMGDEIVDGCALKYYVALSYDGHVEEVTYLGLDAFGTPDAVAVE